MAFLFRLLRIAGVLAVLGVFVYAFIHLHRAHDALEKDHSIREHTLANQLRIRYPAELVLAKFNEGGEAALIPAPASLLLDETVLRFLVYPTALPVDEVAARLQKIRWEECNKLVEGEGPLGLSCKDLQSRPGVCFHQIAGTETTWIAGKLIPEESSELRMRSCTFKVDGVVYSIFTRLRESQATAARAVFKDVLDRSELLPGPPLAAPLPEATRP